MHIHPQAYSEINSHEIIVDGESICFFSKPGLPGWDSLIPSTFLLAEHVGVNNNDRILILGSGLGTLAVYLARKLSGGLIDLTDTNWISLNMVKKTLRGNHIRNTNVNHDINVDPSRFGIYDTVIISLPKGRKLAQRWIIDAKNALHSGGNLYIAGANKLGIKSVIQDAETLLGNSKVLGYKKGHRVARFKKNNMVSNAPSWLLQPGIAPGTWYKLTIDCWGEAYEIFSLPGIFSYDRIDEGTRILLDTLDIKLDSRVLDFGCGNGIIGIAVSKLGTNQVTMVENNLMAIAAARKNLEALKIHNASVIPSDVLEAVSDQEFDIIVSNPPFHTGKEVDYQVTNAFIKQSWSALRPGGKLIIVANRFIRYQQIIEKMFNHCEYLEITNHYHVMQAIKLT